MIGTKTPTRQRGTFGVRRGAGPLMCGLLGVAIILVLAPVAQAATGGTPLVIIKAPFTGATGYTSSSTYSSGCGSGKVVHAPFFNPTSGKGGFALRAHADSCSILFGDSGSASAGETVTLPVPAHSGTDKILAKWTVDATLGSSIGGASCLLYNLTYSYCESYALAQVYGYAYFFDATNDSYWYSNTYWDGASAGSSISDACYYGNCSSNFTGNQHLALATNVVWAFHIGGLVASHHYFMEVSWYADVYAEDYSYQATLTGASEGGFVTMAGPTSGATLDWISIG